MRRTQPPKSLKRDAIVEAILEVRFNRSTMVPEILFGRLADYEPWKGFEASRMPAFDVPFNMRQIDPDLQFVPLIRLLDTENQRFVHIGEQMLSYHQLKPYMGWSNFKVGLDTAIDGLFEKVSDLKVSRIGLRYLNALSKDHHGIKSISDLDIRIDIAEEQIIEKVNINLTKTLFNQTNCTVRVATPDFVQGILPEESSIFIDIDVFTEDGFETTNKDKIKEWITKAHDAEKTEFFRLLTDETIDFLKVK